MRLSFPTSTIGMRWAPVEASVAITPLDSCGLRSKIACYQPVIVIPARVEFHLHKQRNMFLAHLSQFFFSSSEGNILGTLCLIEVIFHTISPDSNELLSALTFVCTPYSLDLPPISGYHPFLMLAVVAVLLIAICRPVLPQVPDAGALPSAF